MNSFYGGKPGASLIVVKHFDSYDEMLTNFAEGDLYTEVQYGQYVIIGHKGGDKQGNIYKRGLEGPEFIFNISGPAGTMSDLDFKPYDKIPTGLPFDQETPFADTSSEGSFTVTNGDLVSGEKQQDSISWRIYNSKNENGQVKSEIGFQIPYLVVDLDVETATDDEINKQEKTLGVSKAVEQPFYQKWTLTVPEGSTPPKSSFIYTNEDDLKQASVGPNALAFKVRS